MNVELKKHPYCAVCERRKDNIKSEFRTVNKSEIVQLINQHRNNIPINKRRNKFFNENFIEGQFSCQSCLKAVATMAKSTVKVN